MSRPAESMIPVTASPVEASRALFPIAPRALESYQPPETKLPAAPPEPSPVELAQNVAKAASRWIGAGFPVVSQAVYDARAAACAGCELWDRKARLGMGKCNAPGCGCTSLKRWLATERCPHPSGPRWPA